MTGRRSSFILSAIVDELQTKTKGHKDQSNINAMNQLKKVVIRGIYYSSQQVLMLLFRRNLKALTNQEENKLEQMETTTRFIM